MLDIDSTISSKEVNMAYKIKEIREKKRMSQAELAEISGVSRAKFYYAPESKSVSGRSE